MTVPSTESRKIIALVAGAIIGAGAGIWLWWALQVSWWDGIAITVSAAAFFCFWLRLQLYSVPGWFVVIALLICALIGIDFDINLFGWAPHWSFQVVACLLGIGALLVCIVFLARITVGRVAFVVSSIPCIIAVAFGIIGAAPEPLGPSGEWLSRRQSSPAWYRWARATTVAIPAVLLTRAFLWPNRRKKSA